MLHMKIKAQQLMTDKKDNFKQNTHIRICWTLLPTGYGPIYRL